MTINPDVVPDHNSVIGQMNLADSPEVLVLYLKRPRVERCPLRCSGRRFRYSDLKEASWELWVLNGVWWDDTASAASGERSMVTSTLVRSRPVRRFGRCFLLLSTKVNRTDSNGA